MHVIAGFVSQHRGGLPFRDQPRFPVRFFKHPGAIRGIVSKDSVPSADTDGAGFLRPTVGAGESLVHGLEIRDFEETVGPFEFCTLFDIIYITRR